MEFDAVEKKKKRFVKFSCSEFMKMNKGMGAAKVGDGGS